MPRNLNHRRDLWPRWLRPGGALAGLLAMAVLLGGHWMVLQSIAWGRMILDYSRVDSVATAISKTFSGEHPCSLCLQIETGRHRGQQDQNQHPLLPCHKSPEWLAQTRLVVVPLPSLCSLRPPAFSELSLEPQFVFALPKPPPRGRSALLMPPGCRCAFALNLPSAEASVRFFPDRAGAAGIFIHHPGNTTNQTPTV